MVLEKIQFKYKFKEDYNPTYANGVYGGINSQGEIIMHFFMERPLLPYSQTYAVEEGTLARELDHQIKPEDLKDSFMRYIETGLVMNIDKAKELHEWLGEQIKEYEEKNIAENTPQYKKRF